MKPESEEIREFRDLINVVLEDCDHYTYPHVCNIASNPNTRPQLENDILKIATTSGISVGQAIDQLERIYNPNKMED